MALQCLGRLAFAYSRSSPHSLPSIIAFDGGMARCSRAEVLAEVRPEEAATGADRPEPWRGDERLDSAREEAPGPVVSSGHGSHGARSHRA